MEETRDRSRVGRLVQPRIRHDAGTLLPVIHVGDLVQPLWDSSMQVESELNGCSLVWNKRHFGLVIQVIHKEVWQDDILVVLIPVGLCRVLSCDVVTVL
jgi:hypothetical protein